MIKQTASTLNSILHFRETKINFNYIVTHNSSPITDKCLKKAAEGKALRPFAVKTAILVRVAGLEPTVSWSQTKRDTKLR